ncbi:MAG: hypothetical protein AAGA77_07640 [Bacteroidota bacterium]
MTPKSIIFLILYVFFIAEASSQDEFGVVFWTEDRDLEWSDFKGSPLVDSTGGFFLDIYIKSLAINTSNLFVQSRLDPQTYVYTNTSYASEELRTDDLLRYFNVYFDLAAYYSNKMVKHQIQALNSDDIVVASNLQIIKNALIEEWRNESARLAIETQYGVEIEQLIMWEEDVERKLSELEKPFFSKSPYSMTLDLTVGPLIGLSEYNEFLSQPTTGVLGVEFSKAPFTYHMGLSGGGQSVKQTFSKGNEVFPANTKPNILNLFLHTGYQLLDVRRWRIVPRIGVHFSNLRYPNSDDNESSVWSTSITTGTTIDYKFKSWNNQANVHMMYSEVSLRLGAYLYPMQVGGQNLSHILLTAGVAWRFGPINASYPN